MKHTQPQLTCELLKFIRDQHPTEDELIAWLGGGPDAVGRFHALRKSDVLTWEHGRASLSAKGLSPDGKSFLDGNALYWLDRGEVWLIRRVPSDPE